MGENTGLAYILIAMLIVFGVGIMFASNFDIQALTFFKGVS